MKNALSLILFFLVAQFQTSANDFFNGVTFFVSTYVEEEKVNYTSISNNPELLDSLVNQIGQMDISNFDQTALKAYYLNSYNLLVIQQVMDYYPINSCQEIDGFFSDTRFLVAGDSLTLDDIEKVRLKPMNDERVHFALVCASLSCPPLDAFTPDNVDLSLKLIRDNYINSDKAVLITEDKEIKISRIFDWYEDAFLLHASSIREYINFFRYKNLPKKRELEYQPYDWTLNDLK